MQNRTIRNATEEANPPERSSGRKLSLADRLDHGFPPACVWLVPLFGATDAQADLNAARFLCLSRQTRACRGIIGERPDEA